MGKKKTATLRQWKKEREREKCGREKDMMKGKKHTGDLAKPIGEGST